MFFKKVASLRAFEKGYLEKQRCLMNCDLLSVFCNFESYFIGRVCNDIVALFSLEEEVAIGYTKISVYKVGAFDNIAVLF